MTVCTFPRSHLSHFVSDFSKNSRSMSKRGQEQNFPEESAVTKPKSMISRSIKDQTNNFDVWRVHDSSRWDAGSDSNIVLSKPESPRRVMRMLTGVTQSLRQGTATELDTTDNERHSQVKIQENVQSTETWKRDGVISHNDSFRQRTPKSLSATDFKTEFLNMEIPHHQLCLERTRIIYDRGLQDQDPSLLRWRQESILDWQMTRMWRSSNTGTSRMLRIRSPSLTTWWWKILRKYWIIVRMTADHRDQVKKWSKTKVRVYSDSVLCFGEWSLQERRQMKNGPFKWNSSRCTPQLTSFMDSMEKLLTWSGKFPRKTL